MFDFGRVLFHFLFGLFTGGIWWAWLFIRYITVGPKRRRRNRRR